MQMDALAQFKAAQRQAWAHVTPFELTTSATAARLVTFAGVQAGQSEGHRASRAETSGIRR
jgi:hypothetical protein